MYRLLQCNFTFAPETEEFTEENYEEYGIACENYLPFKELLNLTEDLIVPDLATRTEQLLWLPPSLGTLTGFRGLDLHRAYLRACASAPFEAENETATITDITDEPTPGPSGYQSEMLSRTMNVQEETIASGSNTQQENNAVLEAPPTSTGVSKTEQSFRNTAKRSVIFNLPVPEKDGRKSTGSSIQVENETSSETDEEEMDDDVEEVDDDAEEVEDEGEDVEDEGEEDEEEGEDEEEREEDEEVDDDGEEVDDDGEEGESPQPPEMPSDVYFGDRIADSLLLSRLTTLFFWSGIMGSM